jgi:saccharopine dehydrogenase (NADP+, L-glutamate forming)
LGLTDHSFPILQSSRLSYHELIEAFLPDSQGTLKERVARFLDEDVDSPVMEKLQWLGLFSRRKINIHQGTPAMILEDLLLEKWEMKPDDNDMILMQHEFEYELGGQQYISRSTLSMKGEDNQNTAMSKLVGLPLGIFVKLVMLGHIDTPGVQIPVDSNVYNPVLAELADYGVVFKEKDDLI